MKIDKTISVPIYDFLIRVVVSDNEEEFEQDVLDAGFEEDVAGAAMIVLHSGYKVYTLVIDKNGISNGNIAHESLHIVNRIWRDIGSNWFYDDDEPQCYLIGFIVDCIHKIIEDGSED